MTQTQWRQLEAALASMTHQEKQRLWELVSTSLGAEALPTRSELWGLFADEADALDGVMESVYEARQSRPLRVP